MAIQNRRGIYAKFDPSKLVQGEFAFCTDTGKLYYCYSAGNVKALATLTELQELLETTTEAYAALQQLIIDLGSQSVLTSLLNTQTEVNTARGTFGSVNLRLADHDSQLAAIAINVKSKGAVGDGVIDDATAILEADTINDRVLYPKGRYLYKSNENPNFNGGLEFVNAHVDGEYSQDIITFDADGKTLVGLQHNHRQITDITNPITNGKIIAPPMSKADIQSPVDIIAHWYNDSGLEYTRLGGGGATWYTWEWNHVGNPNYDKSRHPILGYYRGDDQNVLDWQCYWLKEYGINTVALYPSSDIDTSTWHNQSDRYHWLYQLFTNVKNFNALKYILWGTYSGTALEIQAAWEYMIDNIYLQYRNFKTVEKNGKLYPVIYCFEGGTLFTNLGNTTTAFNNFASVLSTKFKNAGYGGVCIFVRHPKSITSLSRYDLEAVDCLYFTVDYGGHGAFISTHTVDDANTYGDMVDSYVPYHLFPQWEDATDYVVSDIIVRNGVIYSCNTVHTSSTDTCPGSGKSSSSYWNTVEYVSRCIPSLATSKYAIAPHPSTGNAYWKALGSTPKLFEKWLRKVVDTTIYEDCPRMLTIYNVAEWGEGGAGLQPNMQDGFGYLEAVKNVISGYVKTDSLFPEKIRNTVLNSYISGTGSITPTKEVFRLTTDYNRTMTSVPSIKDGKDGQRLKLMNVNSAYTITLQDNGTLAGSNLFLTATTIILGAYDSIELEFVSGKGWVQVGNIVNVI